MGYDTIGDIALIRINSGIYASLHLPVIDSRTQLLIGEYINAIGNPQASDPQSMTRGVVRDNKYQYTYDTSAPPDPTEYYAAPESVFTDASIYGGNSGGPVITDSNKVVGIVSWGKDPEENLNGAVASYLFMPVITYFCTNYSNTVVSYPKGYIGVYYSNINYSDVMASSTITKIEGIFVNTVDTSSPTYPASQFQESDIITHVDGVPIGTYNSQYPFFTAIHLKPPGTQTVITYTRPPARVPTNVTITLAVFNSANDRFLKGVH
jgi:S1-C subfamily serine protease